MEISAMEKSTKNSENIVYIVVSTGVRLRWGYRKKS